MVHLVADEGVDVGPVLATVEVPIRPLDSIEDLRQRMHAAEHVLLVDALGALCTVHLHGTVQPDGSLQPDDRSLTNGATT
jgi:folate-dependent phosphoribosylglycinamide formyltransferase PurN